MSSRRDQVEARQIHPKTLALIGEEASLDFLSVARDLRSGVIPPEMYDQRTVGWRSSCGTPCCILGHFRRRVTMEVKQRVTEAWLAMAGYCEALNPGIARLFDSENPSDPQLAADAIERFVFEGSDDPWKV